LPALLLLLLGALLPVLPVAAPPAGVGGQLGVLLLLLLLLVPRLVLLLRALLTLGGQLLPLPLVLQLQRLLLTDLRNAQTQGEVEIKEHQAPTVASHARPVHPCSDPATQHLAATAMCVAPLLLLLSSLPCPPRRGPSGPPCSVLMLPQVWQPWDMHPREGS
jgi:hypothetical protein